VNSARRDNGKRMTQTNLPAASMPPGAAPRGRAARPSAAAHAAALLFAPPRCPEPGYQPPRLPLRLGLPERLGGLQSRLGVVLCHGEARP